MVRQHWRSVSVAHPRFLISLNRNAAIDGGAGPDIFLPRAMTVARPRRQERALAVHRATGTERLDCFAIVTKPESERRGCFLQEPG